jgi:prepilin-type N-terminal cleavage/methylation domain-containing protein
MRFERHSVMTSKRGGRGFTLVELLVAIIAGLLVAAAAISFSKQSTRFFSQEARIAAAQMSVLSGFQRLQGDISRASYMSTPNMRRDLDNDRVCAPNFAAWPTALRTLTGLRVTAGGSNTVPAKMPDDKYPDSIRIAGSLTSSEVFPVRTIEAQGTGHDVYLQVNTGAMARSGFTEGADLTTVFKPGRVLRIVDQQRKQEYEVITAASFPSGGQPVIRTGGPLPLKGDLTIGVETSAPCGIEGFAVGVQANVVDLVEYGIANLADHPVYSTTIYNDGGYALGDESRTELVRREILLNEDDPGPLEDDDSTEIVAEYAVDLRLGLWATNPGGGLVFIAPSTAAIATRMTVDASYIPGVGPSGPESVRSVELRLAVRSREIDRRANTDETDPVLDGGFMFRYPIPNSNGGFSRVRTLLADVTLPNQGGESW